MFFTLCKSKWELPPQRRRKHDFMNATELAKALSEKKGNLNVTKKGKKSHIGRGKKYVPKSKCLCFISKSYMTHVS